MIRAVWLLSKAGILGALAAFWVSLACLSVGAFVGWVVDCLHKLGI